jgi:hypothetical protein
MPVGSDMHPIPPLKPTTLDAVRDPAAKAILEEIVDAWGRLVRFTQIAREAVVAAGPHVLLDGSTHTDTVAQGVTRGSIIYGNSTPKWTELVIGAAHRVLGTGSAGTDVSWVQADHGAALDGLTDDDHTQYALLAGRAGGQTLIGGTAASQTLTLQSTAHATKGQITINNCTVFEVTCSGVLNLTSTGAGITLLAEASSNVSITGATVSLVGVVSCSNGTSAGEVRIVEPSGGGTSYVSLKAPALAGNTVYTLPTALPAVTGYVLSCTDAGVMSWAVGSGTHAILDGSTHSDSVAATVSRGSLIYGNSTPKWDELVIGTSGFYVRSDGTDASWAALDWPKGYIYGLSLAYASATTATVAAGQARDDTNAANITLSSAVTVDITTLGAAAGLDRATASATATTHGTATFEPSASLYSETVLSATVRSLTGTASSVGTAVTGTSTLFLTEVAVGDVIRSATKGASRVTAIASNTALTLVAAFPGGDCTAEAQTLYENLVVWPDTATAGDQRRVNTITHAGTSVVVSSALTSNGATKTIAIGSELASAWYFVWLVSGGSGTTCILSTQRTTPYGVSGYTTSKRRVGVVRNNASANFYAFDQIGVGTDRFYQYEEIINGTEFVVLSAGTATSWTAVVCQTIVPPTARWIHFRNQTTASAVAGYVRCRNIGSSTVDRAYAWTCTATAMSNLISQGWSVCDGAQAIDYGNQSAGGASYLVVIGFMESLS